MIARWQWPRHVNPTAHLVTVIANRSRGHLVAVLLLLNWPYMQERLFAKQKKKEECFRHAER